MRLRRCTNGAIEGCLQGELARWEKRDLSARRYLYFWADGIYFQPRMEHDKQCILVIIGADQWGRKELLAIADGYRVEN